MSKLRIEIKWALIFTAMMMIWMTLEMLTGLHGKHIEYHPIVTNFIFIPAITVYVLAFRDKKANFYAGHMTYMQGFKFGVLVSVFVAVLSPICLYISMEYISPDYFDNAISYAVDNEKSTLAEAKEYFNLNNYMLEGPVGSLIMGILTSAIVAIFVRSKN